MNTIIVEHIPRKSGNTVLSEWFPGDMSHIEYFNMYVNISRQSEWQENSSFPWTNYPRQYVVHSSCRDHSMGDWIGLIGNICRGLVGLFGMHRMMWFYLSSNIHNFTWYRDILFTQKKSYIGMTNKISIGCIYSYDQVFFWDDCYTLKPQSKVHWINVETLSSKSNNVFLLAFSPDTFRPIVFVTVYFYWRSEICSNSVRH